MKLTKKRKKLLAEIKRIKHIINGSEYDYTTALEMEKQRLVRSRVLEDCLKIEEFMSLIIMNHILQDSKKWLKLKYFGHIKRYSLFFTEILGHIPARQKLRAFQEILEIPKKIRKSMGRIFDLRNSFAHILTFAYKDKKRILYADGSIFDIRIFTEYVHDAEMVNEFLMKKIGI